MASLENDSVTNLDAAVFTNRVISVEDFPRFEEVPLQAVDQKYWIIKLIHMTLFAIALIAAWIVLAVNKLWTEEVLIYTGAASIVILIIHYFFSRLAYKRLGYAFREHDVIYGYGVIAKTTVIIPYNRVQHVALHEGVLSRYYGLATVMIFTAGGSSSDIAIPGIKKEEAGRIKQVLMEKIKKQL